MNRCTLHRGFQRARAIAAGAAAAIVMAALSCASVATEEVNGGAAAVDAASAEAERVAEDSFDLEGI